MRAWRTLHSQSSRQSFRDSFIISRDALCNLRRPKGRPRYQTFVAQAMYDPPAFTAPSPVRGSVHRPSLARRGGTSRRNQQFCTASAGPTSPTSLGVIVTGSTRGLGLSLASHFAAAGDRVLVTSRNNAAVTRAVLYLQDLHPTAQIYGFAADVGSPSDVDSLSAHASSVLGSVDAWICNAGCSTPRVPLADVDADTLVAVTSTNLTGSLLCARAAMREWRSNPPGARGGHVFLMEGAGSDGFATPKMAAYGATKRALPHLISSLRREKEHAIRIHALSPGMVLTGLLLRGGAGTPSVRKVFNVLAEEPETVAEYLVPRIRDTVVGGKSSTAIRFLTIPRAIGNLLAGFVVGYRKNRFFDEQNGQRIGEGRFDENGVRIVFDEAPAEEAVVQERR